MGNVRPPQLFFQDRLILLGGLGEEDRRFRDAWQTMDFGQTWQELPCPKWSGRHGEVVHLHTFNLCQNAGDSFDSFWTFEREIVGF